MTVRNMYLSGAHSNQQIADAVKLQEKQVRYIITRDSLAAEKKRRALAMIAKQDAQLDQRLQAFNSELAEQAEEISLTALQRAREEAIAPGEFGARNFQSWTGGIANLVKSSRLVRGLDSISGAGSQAASNVSVFLVRGEAVTSEPKNVTTSCESGAALQG